MQGNSSTPFFTCSRLNFLYLCGFWGLFYSGWKRDSFLFPLPSLMALLLFFQPCTNPIVSPSLLLCISLFLLSSFLSSCPIFSNPHLPSYPLFFMTPPPLSQCPLSSSPSLCFPLSVLSWSQCRLSSYFLLSHSLCISSPAHHILFHPPLLNVCGSLCLSLHIFSCPHSPLLLPLLTFYFSTLLRGVEKQNLGWAQGSALPVPSVCSSTHLFAFHCPFTPSVCGVCLTAPSVLAIQAYIHTHAARTHTHAHTQAPIATWQSVKLQPHQQHCGGIAVCFACLSLIFSSSYLPLSFSFLYFIFIDHPLHFEGAPLSPVAFHFAFYLQLFCWCFLSLIAFTWTWVFWLSTLSQFWAGSRQLSETRVRCLHVTLSHFLWEYSSKQNCYASFWNQDMKFNMMFKHKSGKLQKPDCTQVHVVM